jgi:hypothetical protein
MNWLNFIGFFIIGFVLLLTVLFIFVCVFDRMLEEQFNLDEREEWNAEEPK